VSGVDAIKENGLILKRDRFLPPADEFDSRIDNLQIQGKGMMSNLTDQMMS